jgi:hypothetical protein
MKRFKSYITEETKKSLCDVLSGNESNFIEFIGSYATDYIAKNYELKAVQFKYSLLEWLHAEGGEKNDIISKLKPALDCKNRAAWTYYTGGKLYRGLYKHLKQTGFKATPNIFQSGRQTFLVGNAVYTSLYPIQSWTEDFDVADHFSSAPRGQYKKSVQTDPLFHFIYEINSSKEQTMFNPKIFEQLMEFASVVQNESEVIRTVNTPVNAKVYIHLNSIKIALSECLPMTSLDDKDEVTKLLVKWFGDAATKALVDRTSILKVRDRD